MVVIGCTLDCCFTIDAKAHSIRVHSVTTVACSLSIMNSYTYKIITTWLTAESDISALMSHEVVEQLQCAWASYIMHACTMSYKNFSSYLGFPSWLVRSIIDIFRLTYSHFTYLHALQLCSWIVIYTKHFHNEDFLSYSSKIVYLASYVTCATVWSLRRSLIL